MQIQSMRKIDYYAGLPLCLLLDFFKLFLGRPRKPGKVVGEVQRILFIKFFGAGALSLSFPAIERARKHFPEAEIYYLTFRDNRGVFYHQNLVPIDHVVYVRTRNLLVFVADTIRALWIFRRARISVSVDLEFFSRFTSILSLLIGAYNRVGFFNHDTPGFYRGNFLTHKVTYNAYQHTAHGYVSLVESLLHGDELPAYKVAVGELPELEKVTVTQEQKRELWGRLGLIEGKKLVLLNPNCSALVPHRRWPESYFVELIKKMAEQFPDTQFGFIGSLEEKDYVSSITNRLAVSFVYNFAGETTLEELYLLLDSASLLVTVDSGPAHLAARTSALVLVLFGPETPTIYRPLTVRQEVLYAGLACSPCVTVFNGKVSRCQDNQCMKKLTPDMVGQRIKSLGILTDKRP